jgi:sarcosine/dimethylglycine N-methyltransferase
VINPGGIQGRDQVLDRLKLAPGDRILELGGGNGYAACHIAKKYRCHVTSIDISERSVQEASRRIAREGLDGRVRMEVGDVNNLSFGDEGFDAVICQAVMMFVNQEKALAEVRRVLKKGGVFSGLEFSWKKNPPVEVRQEMQDA